MERATEDEDSETKEEDIEGFLVEIGQDVTRTYEANEATGRCHPRLIKESHTTVLTWFEKLLCHELFCVVNFIHTN